MIGIYKIENIINHKCYIGQSINIKRRWEIHKSELKNNRHYNKYLQKAWNKYGENSFLFSVIEECSKLELNEKEQYYIKKYNSYANKKNSKGYNLTIGGDGYRQETPVLQFDLLGNIVGEYDNYYEAEQVTGIKIQAIIGCCQRHHKYAGNYIWIKKSEYINCDSLNWNFNNIKLKNIEQYDLHGNLLQTWKQPKDIVNKLGVNPFSCLSHKTYTCGGYIFKYADDDLKIDEDYLYMAQNSLKLHNNKPFYQVDKNCNIIKEYISLSDVVKDGWNERMVNECCRGLRQKYKNYLWILQDEFCNYTPEICKEMIEYNKPKEKYLVKQYDMNNNYIKTYNRLKDVKQDGFLPGNVIDCCLGRKPQYKGYIWKKECL